MDLGHRLKNTDKQTNDKPCDKQRSSYHKYYNKRLPAYINCYCRIHDVTCFFFPEKMLIT